MNKKNRNMKKIIKKIDQIIKNLEDLKKDLQSEATKRNGDKPAPPPPDPK